MGRRAGSAAAPPHKQAQPCRRILARRRSQPATRTGTSTAAAPPSSGEGTGTTGGGAAMADTGSRTTAERATVREVLKDMDQTLSSSAEERNETEYVCRVNHCQSYTGHEKENQLYGRDPRATIVRRSVGPQKQTRNIYRRDSGLWHPRHGPRARTRFASAAGRGGILGWCLAGMPGRASRTGPLGRAAGSIAVTQGAAMVCRTARPHRVPFSA